MQSIEIYVGVPYTKAAIAIGIYSRLSVKSIVFMQIELSYSGNISKCHRSCSRAQQELPRGSRQIGTL